MNRRNFITGLVGTATATTFAGCFSDEDSTDDGPSYPGRDTDDPGGDLSDGGGEGDEQESDSETEEQEDESLDESKTEGLPEPRFDTASDGFTSLFDSIEYGAEIVEVDGEDTFNYYIEVTATAGSEESYSIMCSINVDGLNGAYKGDPHSDIVTFNDIEEGEEIEVRFDFAVPDPQKVSFVQLRMRSDL